LAKQYPAQSRAQRKQNLNKLARYLIEFDRPDPWYVRAYNRLLKRVPPAFCMDEYNTWQSSSPHKVECGSAACAVGHAPSVGIQPFKNESWDTYSFRTLIWEDDRNWAWCFSSVWADYDNSATSAGLRILHYLAYGTPDWYCCSDDSVEGQMRSLNKHYPRYQDALERARILI